MLRRLTLVDTLVDFLLRPAHESCIGTYFPKVTKSLNHRLWKKKMLSIGVVPSRGTGIHCSKISIIKLFTALVRHSLAIDH